jgi:hypothetical protein
MNSGLIIQVLYLFFFSFILAFLETQIEGGSGWAKNLPTWRPLKSKWYSRLYGKVMGGKELTGYHILIFSMVFIFLHYPYFAGKTWNLSEEAVTLSFFFIISIYWDFMWFIINPKYNFRDFLSQHVWWHKKWFLHFPYEYWGGLIISAVLYIAANLGLQSLKKWALIIGLFTVLTIIVMILADWVGVFNLKQENDSKRKILH